MNKNDNINERYEAYEKMPGSMKCALGNFNRIRRGIGGMGAALLCKFF